MLARSRGVWVLLAVAACAQPVVARNYPFQGMAQEVATYPDPARVCPLHAVELKADVVPVIDGLTNRPHLGADDRQA